MIPYRKWLCPPLIMQNLSILLIFPYPCSIVLSIAEKGLETNKSDQLFSEHSIIKQITQSYPLSKESTILPPFSQLEHTNSREMCVKDSPTLWCQVAMCVTYVSLAWKHSVYFNILIFPLMVTHKVSFNYYSIYKNKMVYTLFHKCYLFSSCFLFLCANKKQFIIWHVKIHCLLFHTSAKWSGENPELLDNKTFVQWHTLVQPQNKVAITL